MADPGPFRDIDFATLLPPSKDVTRQAEALVTWWRTFQKPGFLKRNPDCSVLESPAGILRIRGPDDADVAETKIRSSLKKTKVEDLGQMQASDLLASIPAEDPHGRGLNDLRAMEKKLSVKAVFDYGSNGNGHVYLVGDVKKLEKKVFAMRNLLSHYHWRLSGKETT